MKSRTSVDFYPLLMQCQQKTRLTNEYSMLNSINIDICFGKF
jgi:hypothetical protein